jgi:hypothetical protein
MKSDTRGLSLFSNRSVPHHAAITQWVEPRRQNMQEELHALEEQRTSLQLLVSELLLANQKLRLEVARLKQKSEPSAPATHLQPHPGH